MAFGLVNAPMHFQYVIDTLVWRAGNVDAIAYLDDITTHRNGWEKVWSDTLCILKVLTEAGFMINLRKCHFLR